MAKSMDDAPQSQAGLFDGVEMGVGTWQWGDPFVWQYGRGYAAAEVREAFEAALAAGLSFFDTAEVYGLGRSERFLGEFLHTPGHPGPSAGGYKIRDAALAADRRQRGAGLARQPQAAR